MAYKRPEHVRLALPRYRFGAPQESTMKKVLLAIATCALSAMAMSQPVESQRQEREMEHNAMVQRAIEQRDRGGSEMERRPMDRHAMTEHQRRHKVWVPARRGDDGRRMRGHYDWN